MLSIEIEKDAFVQITFFHPFDKSNDPSKANNPVQLLGKIYAWKSLIPEPWVDIIVTSSFLANKQVDIMTGEIVRIYRPSFDRMSNQLKISDSKLLNCQVNRVSEFLFNELGVEIFNRLPPFYQRDIEYIDMEMIKSILSIKPELAQET